MSFADHFSKQASGYAKYRPGYPRALFAWLASIAPAHDLAWDVGTGNGQAAVALARDFALVVATDPSVAQIDSAQRHERVSYRVQKAEVCDLADASVDLVTIAQALHWFDFPRFYAQVSRVLKPGGVIAAWTYGLNRVTPAVDAVVREFYTDVVGRYWPPERVLIEDDYRTIPFPFAEVVAPPVHMETHWSLADYLGYLRTWSATQRFIDERGFDPVDGVARHLADAWGAAVSHTILWPLHIRAGRRP